MLTLSQLEYPAAKEDADTAVIVAPRKPRNLPWPSGASTSSTLRFPGTFVVWRSTEETPRVSRNGPSYAKIPQKQKAHRSGQRASVKPNRMDVWIRDGLLDLTPARSDMLGVSPLRQWLWTKSSLMQLGPMIEMVGDGGSLFLIGHNRLPHPLARIAGGRVV
ncbi:uncharacterized protein BT62DRAFT_924569 [Guyanagaster necrorhizus]|uniref:Uncharacterized protein n=1 Tax=Guyanagaster necrorhizus TaxID=856835 RepID=A0A9P7VFC6_9AGAR|nr:uncharacterized protein BT62DRAFT_924569 [Guyanagaster necrorhizus MCA 3950]KAG7439674.1 hypothetical protein BT62DRAFT_924569 [Guyanagaster necrorhizus MCA 3950]